jgi:hypothetical protein
LDLTLKNNSKNGPQTIPEQTFDLQNGVFDPKTSLVYNYLLNKILRRADQEEHELIYQKYKFNPSQKFQNRDQFDDSQDKSIQKVIQLKNSNQF